MSDRSRRRSPYPDDYVRFAERLYEINGYGPKTILEKLVEERPDVQPPPLDTLKGWLRGKTRGAERDAQSRPSWDFIKATGEERRLLAPLFAADHLREDVLDDGRPVVLPPVVMWPAKDVARWLVAIRQLVPTLPIDRVWMDARYAAMLERRIDDGSATDEDKMRLRQHLADILEVAGWRDRAVLVESDDEEEGYWVSEDEYLDVEEDPETGKTMFQMKPLAGGRDD